MSFSQALSGLNAAKSNLGVLGNNISNSQTVGFKGASSQFADVFANSSVGLGTRVSSVVQDFSAGNLESTNRNLDLAISGEGFFRFQQEGEISYSRNGQLGLTPDGFLENAQGARIMGYGLNAAGDVQVGGQPQVLTVPAGEMPASATTRAATTVNLDSRLVAGEGTSSVTVRTNIVEPPTTEDFPYHFSNNFTVYDSLGNPRNISVYYEKIDEQPIGTPVTNTWTGKVVMNGFYDDTNDFQVEFSQTGLLEFPDDGVIPDITFDTDTLGGDPENLVFDLNLAGSTQFGNTSTTSALTQNGFTSGTLVGITIQNDGTIVRNYTNEQSRPAGQVAMAFFRNAEGLVSVGDNAWRASNDSGQELLGSPGTGQLGTIQSGAIETSNVDMAKQLVDMIISQRAYQANSQTIKTQDELLQTAINLR